MPTLSDILTDTNLYNAWTKVLGNKGCAGIDGVDLTAFSHKLWLNLETIVQEVKYNSYRPKPLLRVEIDKKSGGPRALSIPVIRDRVLQTAVAQVLPPLFEAEFIETNPIPIKCALALKGMCEETYRLPMCELRPENKEKLKQVLTDMKVI